MCGWNVQVRLCVVGMCGQGCVWMECVGKNVCGWNVQVRLCVVGMCRQKMYVVGMCR